MNSIDSPLSDTRYYSPDNSDNEDLDYNLFINIMECNCNYSQNSCLILCFNKDTDQFESIDCKIFNKQFIILDK